MNITILIGGEAGLGSARTSSMIGKAFTIMGYYVFNYRDYPSLIRGGHNFNVLHISSELIASHENNYDIILALDKKTIEKHEKNLKKDGIIIVEKSLLNDNIKTEKERIIALDSSPIIAKYSFPSIMINNILAGSLFKIMEIDLEALLLAADKEFKDKAEKIKLAIREGYKLAENIEEKKLAKINKKIEAKKSNPKIFISGNEAIGLGAIASNLDIYFAYPMTPATPLMNFLAARQKQHGFLVLQLEDEIACINAAIAASYAGAITMTGTSGGGFALMTEAISLQGMNEIPLVVYLAQRTGPSTGVPTYTEQADLEFALKAGHGEFPKVVIAPGDAKEAFQRTIEAFYLSQKYRVVSIILGDKHLGESTYSFDTLEFDESLIPKKIKINDKKKDYKSYLITDSGISPRELPGSNFVVRASSYEHDEYGITTEDPKEIARMKEKRLRKLDQIREEIKKFAPFSIYGNGNNIILSWGSTKGAIIDALRHLDDYKFIQISYLSPFPIDVKKEIKEAKSLIVIENNATSCLSRVIAENTGIIVDNKILKYDGRPFTPRKIIDELKKLKIA
ncbi:MAG: 2-oxoacid:acceptor oxidoreductase subunit alpha [Candidatus Aenigmatarchaeota archaeon]|nr:2-oxoacid:acceptor oxidoreductase subunit alpha [Candidatus Aenigmarchaeota archaeon]